MRTREIRDRGGRALQIGMVVMGALMIGFMAWSRWGPRSTADAAAQTPTSCALPSTPATPSRVGYYVLAYDNAPTSTFDLGNAYQSTVDRLVDATAARADSIVVVLADQGQVGDTHLLIITGGVSTRIDCLPNAEQTLSAELREWDVTDGTNLGNYLIWARKLYGDQSDELFSYIGHGGPVTPYTVPKITEIIGVSQGQSDSVAGDGLSPLPNDLGHNPGYTDYNGVSGVDPSILTVNDLKIALAAATNNGADPFEIVDLLHCFAASIDQLSELAPYAIGLVGSPNYAFFDPVMPGASFENDTFIEDIVATYDGFHPVTGHPHIIVGVEGDTISGITDHWNTVSAALMSEFESDPEGTVDKLTTAYRNSVKYDTTYCGLDPDWALEPPDGLSDMKSFAIELQTAYGGSNSTLNSALSNVIDEIGGTILSYVSVSGVPYFDAEDPSTWTFLNEESGISLFTPFETDTVNGTAYLPWQVLWYTDDAAIRVQDQTLENPAPFSFISGPDPTWADVVNRYLAERDLRPGVNVETLFYAPQMIPTNTAEIVDVGVCANADVYLPVTVTE